MDIALSSVHYIYIAVIVIVIAAMVSKKDTAMICILGIFILGLVATSSVSAVIGGVFNSFIYAINELSGTILIISVITGLCKLLDSTGISEVMVSPVTRFIKTPSSAYWVIGIIMFVISSFFWPSPAVALVGAVFLPVAMKAKLPAIGVAVAMNLFGHGIALSGDFIIQAAPRLAADGAGIPTEAVIKASIPLVITMGAVTTITAFILLKREINQGRFQNEENMDIIEGEPDSVKSNEFFMSEKMRKIFAFIIPIAYICDLVVMMTLKLSGGDATALIGGTSLLMLIAVAVVAFRGKSFSVVCESIVGGFKFGFTVFGPVIPIAAFFFLGDGGAFSGVFGDGLMSSGIVDDLGIAFSQVMPVNAGLSALAVTGVGAITGLDGSGFSGINLCGSVAKLFSIGIGHGVETLAALGQVTAIWVGGGTIIPWSVIPVAAICGVNPIELAAKNLKPVVIGLIATTIVAAVLL